MSDGFIFFAGAKKTQPYGRVSLDNNSPKMGEIITLSHGGGVKETNSFSNIWETLYWKGWKMQPPWRLREK
jgi:hypothetical protein